VNLKYVSPESFKIAVLSLADIGNYGDMFFPFIFRAELLRRFPNAKIDLITNTEFACSLYETNKYEFNKMSDYNAIILAGGETIQRLDKEEWIDIYHKDFNGRPSDIVFEWLKQGGPYKAWFSVGVHPNMYNYREDMLFALRGLNYLAVRGELSKKIIETDIVLNYNNIRIVPDIGWLFSNYIDLLSANVSNQIIPASPYMVFQVLYEFDDETLKYSAKTLLHFQNETKVKVVLLPIVHTKSRKEVSTWNDHHALSKIFDYSGGLLTLMPDGLGIAETGILLKCAKFFVGGSMHGAVTCLAYGKPGANILTWTAPKLQDLHGARMRTDCFVNNWGKLPGLLNGLDDEAGNESDNKHALMYADYMRYRLSVEIDNLCKEITAYNSRGDVLYA